MIKLNVTWLKDPNKLIFGEREIQEKSFKDETSAIEWIRKNSAHIIAIGNTFFTSHIMNKIPLNHSEIMDAIRRSTKR